MLSTIGSVASQGGLPVTLYDGVTKKAVISGYSGLYSESVNGMKVQLPTVWNGTVWVNFLYWDTEPFEYSLFSSIFIEMDINIIGTGWFSADGNSVPSGSTFSLVYKDVTTGKAVYEYKTIAGVSGQWRIHMSHITQGQNAINTVNVYKIWGV